MMPALVIGGAACVWQDIRALATLGGYQLVMGHTIIDGQRIETVALADWPGLVICVNDIAAYYPGQVHHWVSLHPNKFPRWQALRTTWPGGMPVRWCHADPSLTPTYADRQVPQHGGSTGLFAAYEVGTLQLHCAPIVLCGIPMTQTPHFHKQGRWLAATGFTATWEVLAKEGKLQHVRSMSPDSFTQTLLGVPVMEWLKGERAVNAGHASRALILQPEEVRELVSLLRGPDA